MDDETLHSIGEAALLANVNSLLWIWMTKISTCQSQMDPSDGRNESLRCFPLLEMSCWICTPVTVLPTQQFPGDFFFLNG